jgi:hypothetical protein
MKSSLSRLPPESLEFAQRQRRIFLYCSTLTTKIDLPVEYLFAAALALCQINTGSRFSPG